MERSASLPLALLAVTALLSWQPADAWYKQATGPSYYSVGRASGLLSGIRRSPYMRRSEPEAETDSASPELGSRHNAVLKSMAICVKDISPNLQSCELVQDGTSTFQCKADVFVSLDALECGNA